MQSNTAVIMKVTSTCGQSLESNQTCDQRTTTCSTSWATAKEYIYIYILYSASMQRLTSHHVFTLFDPDSVYALWHFVTDIPDPGRLSGLSTCITFTYNGRMWQSSSCAGQGSACSLSAESQQEMKTGCLHNPTQWPSGKTWISCSLIRRCRFRSNLKPDWNQQSDL